MGLFSKLFSKKLMKENIMLKEQILADLNEFINKLENQDYDKYNREYDFNRNIKGLNSIKSKLENLVVYKAKKIKNALKNYEYSKNEIMIALDNSYDPSDAVEDYLMNIEDIISLEEGKISEISLRDEITNPYKKELAQRRRKLYSFYKIYKSEFVKNVKELESAENKIKALEEKLAQGDIENSMTILKELKEYKDSLEPLKINNNIIMHCLESLDVLISALNKIIISSTFSTKHLEKTIKIFNIESLEKCISSPLNFIKELDKLSSAYMDIINEYNKKIELLNDGLMNKDNKTKTLKKDTTLDEAKKENKDEE